MQTFGLTWA